MSELTSEKLQKLTAMLQREPNDSFLLYGIGMEYKKLGDREKALEFFARLIQADPGYCYAYYQQAQTYEQLGNVDQAKHSYREGIAAAKRVGDAHAQSELGGALEMLG